MQKICSFVVCLFLLTACHDKQVNDYRVSVGQDEFISLRVDRPESDQVGKLAFVQHGLASNRDHPAVQAAKQAFLDDGYVVVTFDSRYSTGQSSGDVINVRLSTFEEDLNTVIEWAKTQKFYVEPFALAGHSLGGASVLQYAWEHPDKVAKVIGITPVVSGQLWEKSCMTDTPEFCTQWKQNGHFTYQHNGQLVSIPYQVVESTKAYDALQQIQKVKADVLLLAAAQDKVIHPQDIENLYQQMGRPCCISVISDSGHNFESAPYQQNLKEEILKFIDE